MPKADPTATVTRKSPPKGATTKNEALDIPKIRANSRESFTDFDDVVEFLRVCYWGREGSAKTTNSLTLANTGKVVLINAEGGAKKKALIRQGINVDNVKFWPRPGEKITNARLESLYDTLAADLAEDPNSWAGVIFDSATDVVQGITPQVSDHRVDKARKKGFEIDEFDEFNTDVGDYGIMSKMFVDKLRKFRDLPLHVVYTALERRDVDKASGDVMYGPAVTPGVATSLLGYVDIIIHCSAADETNPFRGLTKEGGIYRVKDRFGMLPRVMVEPTMERIIEYAEGEFDDQPDDRQALYVPPVKKSGKKVKTTAAADDTPVEAVTPPDAEA